MIYHNGVEMDLQDGKRPTLVYMWLVAFAAAMGGLMYGYELGVIGQVLGLRCFQVDFGLKQLVVPYNNVTALTSNITDYSTSLNIMDTSDSEFREGLITSSFLFAGLIGSTCASFVADSFGRRKSIM